MGSLPLAIHCPTVLGSGQLTSCNTLPHCLGAAGSGPPAIHSPTAGGQWAADLRQCTTSPHGGRGQWTSCNTVPHCLGAVGSGPPAIHCPTAWGAVGSGPPAMHCLTARGQWAVDLVQYTAPLPEGSGQWTFCNRLPHCLGAVGSGPLAIHCPTAWGSGQWTSWQQSKNPQDGSCRTDCLHAVPRSKLVVNRRDSRATT